MASGEPFGAPGIGPTWSPSAKDLVTTALGPSRLWATVGLGILNEVYWPSTGEPQIRDLGFIVADDREWFEVKRVNRYRVTTPKPYLPLARIVHEGERYRLTLEFIPDPLRDVLLISFDLAGAGFRLYPLLAPHLGATGWDNTAWVEDGALFAQGGAGEGLCLMGEQGFTRASAGYVGASDGWQDFNANGRLTWEFARAANGNVALIGELENQRGVLALGFAESPTGAGTLATSSLVEGADAVRKRFAGGWDQWHTRIRVPVTGHPELEREAWLSAVVLKAHQDRTYPGATVASLSIPWGNSHNDAGGYHLVWARDTVETGLSLLALSDLEGATEMLSYLVATQSPDGHWSQNFFPDGRPYWTGLQLDEVGFPIVFARRALELGLRERPSIAPMVRNAASYLARNGPISPQDRWEENPGASPFTLAVEVSALVAAAEWLDGAERTYALELADCWNERIEEWTYVEDTDVAREHGVAGYYVRIGPPPAEGGLRGRVQVQNREGETVAASALVGLEFLYLARLGLREAGDPRLTDTLDVVDALLRVDTPNGAVYHRYPDDGYGEHADGSPFDGHGIGRGWPLLAGERGHGELLLRKDPLPYLNTMARTTGPGGLIPEQVWDADPIPERFLYPGRPSGSAMPLVWAHAEFLKLLAAAATGRPIELLDVVKARYNGERPRAGTWFWRDAVPFTQLDRARTLVIEGTTPFSVEYSVDEGRTWLGRDSAMLGLGMHGVRFAAAELADCTTFRFRRPDGAEETIAIDQQGTPP
jgi:glucoamylase